MKKILVLALCLLSILACNKRPAPAPVSTAPAVLPQFAQLNDLYTQFQGFRNDRLYLRHGFTANFPQSDWLQRVRELGQDPELTERSRLLASLAIASRIHGDTSQITRSFEKRFSASLHTPGPPLPEEEGIPDAVADAEPDAQTLRIPAEPAANATDETRVETSESNDVTVPEQPAEPRHAEPAFSPPVQADADQTAEIPPASVPAQAQTTPAEPTHIPATGERVPSPEVAEPDTLPTPATSPRPVEDPAPATSPGAEVQTIPAGTETAAPTGDTPIQATVSSGERPAHLPEHEQHPAPNQPETDEKITILFTGDTQGVVYPQPGITGTVGGIARRLPAIERMRTEAPALVLLDAGDAFVSGFPRAERINKTLVRAMNRMRYDAMGLGPYDLDMGEMALRELASVASFPFVCSNLEFQKDARSWIKQYVLIERGQHTIAVISILEPDQTMKITGARLIAPELAMNKLMPQLAAKADAVVLLTQTGREQILPMLGAAQDVNVILGDARSAFQETPRYVPAVAKSMGLGFVELDKSDGVFRPGRSIPLFTSGVSDSNLLRMLDEIQK